MPGISLKIVAKTLVFQFLITLCYLTVVLEQPEIEWKRHKMTFSCLIIIYEKQYVYV